MVKNMPKHLFILFILSVSTNGNYNSCEQKSPCQCDFSDESTISLSNLFPNDNFLNVTKGNLTYFYHGCTNSKFHVQISDINKTAKDPCSGYDLTLCLFNSENRILLNLGDATEGKFVLDADHPKSQDLVYVEQEITTTVTLICAEDYIGPILRVEDSNQNSHKLTLLSSLVCKVEGVPGLSTGSKLLIIFSVFFGIYLIGGSCLSYFLKGARGKEVIPNIDFWTSLPGLVRDGIIFIMNGCNSRMVPTAETYDQI